MLSFSEWKRKRNEHKYELRETIMRAMDDYIHNITDDEELAEGWLMCAIPDGSEPEEFAEYAKDDELWQDCLRIFQRVVKADEWFDEDEEEDDE